MSPAKRPLSAPWSLLRPSAIALLACLAFVTVVMLSHKRGPVVFHDSGSGGYDGTLFYQIAVSSLGAASQLDHPAYRYQRILYPLLARVLGFGRPQGISLALLGLNIVALVPRTELLGHILEIWKANRWYALIFTFFIGQWVALRFDTSEPLCYLFIPGGILSTERKHSGATTVLFALAMCAKDLALYFIAAYGIAYMVRKEWTKSLATWISLIPYSLLQVVLWLWLKEFALTSGPGAAFAPLPFLGYLQRGFSGSMAFVPLVLLLPALLGSIIGSSDAIRRWPAIEPIPLALLLHALLIIFLPFEASGEIRAAGRIAIGLVLAMLLTGARLGAERILNYSILWIPLSAIYLPSLLFGI